MFLVNVLKISYRYNSLRWSLSKGSQPVFTQVLEKTTENSEQLGRQARPGFEPDTSHLPVLSVTTFYPVKNFSFVSIISDDNQALNLHSSLKMQHCERFFLECICLAISLILKTGICFTFENLVLIRMMKMLMHKITKLKI